MALSCFLEYSCHVIPHMVAGDSQMLRQVILTEVPEDTRRLAKMLHRKSPNLYMRMGDEFSDLFSATDFVELFPERGQSAIDPARLFLLTLVQYLEKLTDRAVVDQLTDRVSLRYLLKMSLYDEVFHFSALERFRQRCAQKPEVALRLFDKVLVRAKELKLLKANKQRSDSAYIFASVASLNRLELVWTTFKAALDGLAHVASKWLKPVVLDHWEELYAETGFGFDVPEKEEAKAVLASLIGKDGFYLLQKLEGKPALLELDQVITLRKVWDQQFETDDSGDPKLREHQSMLPSAELIISPFETDARFSMKRGVKVNGYKAQVTETCDEGLPRLITDARLTPATTADVVTFPEIHKKLIDRDLRPIEHLVDKGYTSNLEYLQTAFQNHGIRVIGAPRQGNSWQKKAGLGFDAGSFRIDWKKESARCPMGATSISWIEKERRGSTVITARFSKTDCQNCPALKDCTTGASRTLELKPKELHEFGKKLEREQNSVRYRKKYAARAGIEGSLSFMLNKMGLRSARYKGLEKTQQQLIFTAMGVNLKRLVSWIAGIPMSETRTGHFAQLMKGVAAA